MINRRSLLSLLPAGLLSASTKVEAAPPPAEVKVPEVDFDLRPRDERPVVITQYHDLWGEAARHTWAAHYGEIDNQSVITVGRALHGLVRKYSRQYCQEGKTWRVIIGPPFSDRYGPTGVPLALMFGAEQIEIVHRSGERYFIKYRGPVPADVDLRLLRRGEV